LPFAGDSGETLEIGPLSTVADAWTAVWSSLLATPAVVVAAIAAAAMAALLPVARSRWRYGVIAIGLVATAGSVLAGAELASTVVVLLVWAGAGTFAALVRRA
jgi:hypothetical protein